MARRAVGAEKGRNQRQAAREPNDARHNPEVAGKDAARGHCLQDRGEVVETCRLDGETFFFEKVHLTDVGRDCRINGYRPQNDPVGHLRRSRQSQTSCGDGHGEQCRRTFPNRLERIATREFGGFHGFVSQNGDLLAP